MFLPFHNDYMASASKGSHGFIQSDVHALSNSRFLVLVKESDFGHGQDESLSVQQLMDVFNVANATDINDSGRDREDCAIRKRQGRSGYGNQPSCVPLPELQLEQRAGQLWHPQQGWCVFCHHHVLSRRLSHLNSQSQTITSGSRCPGSRHFLCTTAITHNKTKKKIS